MKSSINYTLSLDIGIGTIITIPEWHVCCTEYLVLCLIVSEALNVNDYCHHMNDVMFYTPWSFTVFFWSDTLIHMMLSSVIFNRHFTHCTKLKRQILLHLEWDMQLFKYWQCHNILRKVCYHFSWWSFIIACPLFFHPVHLTREALYLSQARKCLGCSVWGVMESCLSKFYGLLALDRLRCKITFAAERVQFPKCK